jgi:hypothetical protein
MAGPRRLRARPTCAVCRQPVEDFTEEQPDTGALRGFAIFVARCHGAIERQRVDRRLLRGLNFGMAFADPGALAPADEPRALPPLQDPRLRR